MISAVPAKAVRTEARGTIMKAEGVHSKQYEKKDNADYDEKQPVALSGFFSQTPPDWLFRKNHIDFWPFVL